MLAPARCSKTTAKAETPIDASQRTWVGAREPTFRARPQLLLGRDPRRPGDLLLEPFECVLGTQGPVIVNDHRWT